MLKRSNLGGTSKINLRIYSSLVHRPGSEFKPIILHYTFVEMDLQICWFLRLSEICKDCNWQALLKAETVHIFNDVVHRQNDLHCHQTLPLSTMVSFIVLKTITELFLSSIN